jgi:flagellar motility protein MotE (MotC chaperone)
MIVKDTALQDLQQLHEDQPLLQKYLQDQRNSANKELRQARRQIEKDKAERLYALEASKDERLQAIREKEQKMLNWESQAKLEEEKYLNQFAKQKEAILKQK